MVLITSHGRVTLVHHHGHHTFAICRDGDVVEAPTPIVEPSSGKCNNWCVIIMVLVVTFWYWLSHSEGAPPSPPLFKTIESELSLGVMPGMSIKFEDAILGLLLLNSLPESWETFKVSITNSTPNGVVSLQMVNGSVLNKEMRRHKENKGKNGKLKEKDDDRVTIVASDDVVILRDSESINLVSDESHFGVLKMGNDGVTKVIGIGDVCLQTNTGMELWLRGIKHDPDVRFNLISVHMLDDGGYDNHFGYRKWKLTKGNLVVARGEKISKLYWTKALVAKDSVNAMNIEAFLWHRRLSHISEKWLNCLAKKNMLLELKNAKLEKCSHCMAGKKTRVSFKKYPLSRKSKLLELVHSNVCGPLKVKSFSDALYFVTFIDDCSRKLWVYTLKSKDQVLEKFKHFQALVKRQSGRKVKYIRSDNGGEYCGPFDGIRHEKIPPKTPQLNGLAERMNERVKCMLSEIKLPKHFLGETLYTTVHVINLSLAVALNTEVSDKIWFDKDVNYKAFVHVPKDERSKLDMKTRQCIFIGYGHDEYGYRMYDPVEKKLVRSRDVQFMEDQTIKDIDKVKKSTPQKDNNLFEIDPVRMPVHDLDTVDNNVQNGEQHNYVGDQQLGDGFDVPLDDDAKVEQEISQDENPGDAPEPPLVQLRMSNRQRQLSTWYTYDEYVTLKDGEELKCYQESMESEERQKT
ncbi:hypothetical protein CR513_07924, partial [Mucuna pruriens]